MQAKILVISGSSREGSVNTKLATLAAAKFKAAGAAVTQINYPVTVKGAIEMGDKRLAFEQTFKAP